MEQWRELLVILLVIGDLALYGMSRLVPCIRIVAFQGVVLGFLTLFAAGGHLTLHMALLALASMAVKGLVFPWLLLRTLRGTEVRREIDPFVGYNTSIFAGLVLLGVSLWLGRILPAAPDTPAVAVPAAMLTMFTGLFITITRRSALAQVLGYLTFENGIYAFGVMSVGRVPFLVELGVLLDVFVAVFVMGIALRHINRAFDHLNADSLDSLKG
ncbi:MAG: hypothetical protein ABIF71_15085 [Planctomycetota bacterium]